ncbi:MAG: queuosine precursor transporter, partial [Dehalococcoidales bacterium]|nr:queuosine precursor transporter [Dehalococcoidales bacterium]
IMQISNRFVIITAIFITCLITANIIAVKIVSLGFLVLPAAVFVFPLSYIFGDILTEVYGYRWTRKIIWLGFICNLIFVFFAWVAQALPPASFWEAQAAYERILGYAPRLMVASFLGYLAGEFTNSFILVRMKILTRGRWLWSRTIGSTIIGQGLDTAIFITVAFAGTPSFLPVIILYHWLAKTAIEALATPLTYVIVNSLKKREAIDTYDYETNFNPFSIAD